MYKFSFGPCFLSKMFVECQEFHFDVLKRFFNILRSIIIACCDSITSVEAKLELSCYTKPLGDTLLGTSILHLCGFVYYNIPPVFLTIFLLPL